MADPARSSFDEEDDEVIPTNASRRRTAIGVGCLLIVLIVGLLIWFGVTHTDMGNTRQFLGSRQN